MKNTLKTDEISMLENKKNSFNFHKKDILKFFYSIHSTFSHHRNFTTSKRLESTSKNSKMQIFQRLQKLLPAVGIYPSSCPQEGSFSLKNKFVVILFGIVCIFTTSFILFKAKTMNEFSESFYITLTLYTGILVAIELGRKIIKLIDDFDRIIQKSNV